MPGIGSMTGERAGSQADGPRGHRTGVAVIPRPGRDPVPDGVRFVPVRPALTRHVHVAWRAHADRRPSNHAFIETLRESTPPGLHLV
ncbi:hypothetical protein GCM10027176_42450 [Actinoallomurus bryophytorum]